MPILIDKVRVFNFRSLQKCSITLTPVTLILGANNSGKTSFLRALNLVLGAGMKRIVHEDFYCGNKSTKKVSEEIIIDVRLIPVDDQWKRIPSFDEIWTEKQFGSLINLDQDDKAFFAFRTRVTHDLITNEYGIKRYKIKVWSDEDEWEKQVHDEELKQYFDAFPFFFMDAQRDIVQDLRDRTSYFSRLINKVKIDDKLLQDIEAKIANINESIVVGSNELQFLKKELQKLKHTLSTNSTIEINPVNKKIRDIHRGININLQDTASESFPLDYYGMGTRSWATLLTYGAFISWQHKTLGEEGQPFHAILGLEEPEAHLHPHAQRTLYKQLAEMKGQKIISTHSPFIAAQCMLDELRHFKKKTSVTEIESFDPTTLTDEEKRRLRREVLNTRGELLFARAVVLFEGETEEQAIPIFSQKYWGKHPYEMGISFVGIGGDGNYKPFLSFLKAFEINWYIFSDGEQRSIKNVNTSLQSIGIDVSKPFSNVVTIPDNLNIEGYLLQQGYQTEIRKAIVDLKKANEEIQNEKHLLAKEMEVKDMPEDKLLEFMKKHKAKLSSYYSLNISALPDKRSIPDIICTLFDAISKDLNEVRL